MERVERESFKIYDDDAERLVPWRMNLLAVDACASRLFVGIDNEVHMYALDATKLCGTPAIVAKHLRPINALRHGYLGNLGEVVVSTDDVGHIIVLRLDLPDMTRTALHFGNSGHSSWGIALASDAELIAISANNCRVALYDHAAIANIGPPKDRIVTQPTHHDIRYALELTEAEQDQYARTLVPPTAILPRAQEHNLPAVDMTPDGRWIAVASIDRTCVLYDREKNMRRSFSFRGGWGWGVRFIDCSTFTHVDEGENPYVLLALDIGRGYVLDMKLELQSEFIITPGERLRTGFLPVPNRPALVEYVPELATIFINMQVSSTIYTVRLCDADGRITARPSGSFQCARDDAPAVGMAVIPIYADPDERQRFVCIRTFLLTLTGHVGVVDHVPDTHTALDLL